MARYVKPQTVHAMAARRGLTVKKAKRGGWYVFLTGMPWDGILYCSHSWDMVREFIRGMPCLKP